MASYNTIEPTVIEEELLRKSINEQATGDAAEIARKEGIDPNEVLSLRLDYKNILKIDNLWAFQNLTKLQLDNNIIEKIENINFLVNLEWLDLSFNNISKIEGLEGLTKLTDLTLFNNRISKLENMNDLVNLNVLSIGNNLISTKDELSYLMRFENLRLLNVSGNPLCKDADFRHYILAHLSNLKYVDYRLIDEDSIKQAREKYIDGLIALEEEEKILVAKKEEFKKIQEQEKIYQNAYIPKIDNLFDSLFDDDPDVQKLIRVAPGPINDFKEEYRRKFTLVVNELKGHVLKQHNSLLDEEGSFRDCIQNAMQACNQHCISLIKKFNSQKKKMLKLVQLSRDAVEVDETVRTLKDNLTQLSDELMKEEMIIVEQFEDIIKEFERNFNDMRVNVGEFAQNSFVRFRELENEYHERATEAVLYVFDKAIKTDFEEYDEEQRDIMSDKDSLVNLLNSSHDYHLGQYDWQEDTLVTGLNKNQETLIQSIHDEEAQRNRARVSEIVEFVEKCMQEIEQADENAY